MTFSSRDGLASELTMIESMLQAIPRGRVLERIGLERRATSLRDELKAMQTGSRTVALTFRGVPVEGTHSIVADFAGKAVASFAEAIGTLVAGLTGQLGESGPLSGSPERSLRIIGPAYGSFGFQLELPDPVSDRQITLFDPAGQDPHEAAVEGTIFILEAAQGSDEENLAERLSSVHPRAITKVREFVDFVVKREAVFSLRTPQRSVDVRDLEAARRISECLAENDIRREEVRLHGRFFALPTRGTFELQTEGQGVISGRIDRQAGETSNLAGHIVDATLRVLRVRQARPRYTLLQVARRTP